MRPSLLTNRLFFVATACTCGLGFLVACPSRSARADDASGSPRVDETSRISFLQEVIPTLTRAGCNSGSCHGSPNGKNGFRLSLRGYDVDLDATTLMREVQGRRINRLEPERSLLLLKGAAEVPHQGGRRFRSDSPSFRLLRDWIAQGATDDRATARFPERLVATPPRIRLEGETRSEDLRVTAWFGDGTARDVTHLARFSVSDPEIAELSGSGSVVRRKNGETTITAEYLGNMVSTPILALDSDLDFVWSPPPENNFIDTHVFARLKLLRLPPSELCSDAEFVRRVHLDVIGRLPEPAEVRAFLADSEPDKRNRLIDDLLGRPEYGDWWGMKWADRLGCNQRFVGKIGAIKYHTWIRDCISANMPEDEFATAVLTSSGGNYGSPAAGFYRRLLNPAARAEEIAQLFLGIRMQCARCHNHPAEKWTQDDYYGLAAFFSRIGYKTGPFFAAIYDREETVFPTRTGEVKHPRTGQVVPPKFPGGTAPQRSADVDPRRVFAAWLTSPDNRYFARAAVNRYWYHLMGRGIVEPVDDFRGSNPPSHPELLDALAAEFAKLGFDRRNLIRTIVRSRTYQLSSRPNLANGQDQKYFSHGRVRLLPAEALLDAVSSATGVPEKFPNLPAGTPAAALPDGEYSHPFLETFGRPARAMACECERDPETNLSQALQLAGGAVVHRKIRSDEGRVAALAKSGATDDEAIDELFLATLSRFPSTEERALCRQSLQRPAAERRIALEDLLWSLINHREFLFQH